MLLRHFKQLHNNNKGFTLVELVVVLTLMAIILGVSSAGLLGWLDWVKFNHQNAAAEDIYYAAQNQLTELDSSGALENRLVELRDSNGNYKSEYIIGQGNEQVTNCIFNVLTDDDGNNYNWKTFWTDSNKATEERTIIRLMVGSNRYDDYINNRDSVEAEERLLFDLISQYISDKSVLNGAISVEFSPEAAQIFSVCYSDSASAFAYNDSDSSKVDIHDRTRQVRWDSMFGYFGVDSLSRKLKGHEVDMGSYSFMIENSTTLNLVVKNNTINQPIDGDLNFVLKGASLYEGGYSEFMYFTIEEDCIDSIQTLGINTVQKAIKKPTPIKVHLKDGAYQTEETTGTDFWMPIWVDTERKVYIALDIADIQAQSVTYAKSLGLLGSNETEIENAKKAFRNTYSFYRFGVPGVRFIQGEVSVTDPGNNNMLKGKAKAGDWVPNINSFREYGSNEGAAVTFANYSAIDNDDEFTYSIVNGRHFYNIRFESDYSDLLRASTSYGAYVSGITQRDYKLKNDIDWLDFTQSGSDKKNYLFNSKDNTASVPEGFSFSDEVGINLNLSKLHNTDLYGGTGTAGVSFPGFLMLSYIDSFSALKQDPVEGESKVYSIKNINVSLGDNCIYGVYGESIKKTIDGNDSDKYETISEQGKAGYIPIGLFTENFGNISNAELDHIVISGIEKYSDSEYLYTSKVGGFVGESFGVISNLYVDENLSSEETSDSFIRGRSDVGGIVGHQYYIVAPVSSALVTKVEIKGCINNAKVTGIGYVGGIIGRIYPEGLSAYDTTSDVKVPNEPVSFSNCYIVPTKNEGSIYQKAAITKFVIKECENHGEISMDEYFTDFDVVIDENVTHRGFYFGGITGAAFDKQGIDENPISASGFDSKKESVVIEKCVSYTLYDRGELFDLLKPDETSEDSLNNTRRMLRANFVGGIVGGARYAHIKDCSSTPNKEDSAGEYSFVLGDRYVGGVAGYAEECIFSGSEDYNINELTKVTEFTREVISNSTSLGYRKNYSIINGTGAYGNYAVGGIAGALGRPDGDTVGKDGSNREFVRNILERCYKDQNYYDYPANCGEINNSNNQITGLLNTAVVLGGSYDSAVNSNDDELERGALFYGVGGVSGLLSTTINNADNIQTESTKKLALDLICVDTTTSIDNVFEIREMLPSEVTELIDASLFVTDGVGGIVGHSLGKATINGGKSYNSQIDAIVFGRNRVGGAVGDVSACGDTAGLSKLSNFHPSKIAGSSSVSSTGMFVLGNDNVGGFVGAFDDNGKEYTETAKYTGPGLNTSDYYDGVSITTSYCVIGHRAVGGLIGTCCEYRYDASHPWKQTINSKIVLSDNDRVLIKGDMYVGGIVGVQEGKIGNNARRYNCSLAFVNIEAGCFSGAITGALFSRDELWPVNELVKSKDKEDSGDSIKNITIKSNLCAAYVAGLYAYNDFNSNDSNDGKSNPLVLYNVTDEATNVDNYKPVDDGTKRKSCNGLYNIKEIDGFEFEYLKPEDYSADEVRKDSKLKEKIKSASPLGEVRLKATVDIIKATFDGYPSDLDVGDDDFDDAGEPDTSNSTNGMNLYRISGFKQANGGAVTINADIYAGGLFGITADYVPIKVVNYRNRARIYTKTAIMSQELGTNDSNLYSYMGGVVGKVPLGMTLTECWNSSGDYSEPNNSSDYKTYGEKCNNDPNYISDNATFKGGLAEINAGIIEGCYNDVLCYPKYYKDMYSVNNTSIIQIKFIGRFKTTQKTGNYVGLNGTLENSSDTPAVIKNCTNYQRLYANVAGGIVSSIGGYSQIIECKNVAKLIQGKPTESGSGVAGGIVGTVINATNSSTPGFTLELTNNVNEGTVNCSDVSGRTAGIIYDSQMIGDISGCRNYSDTPNYAITSSETGHTAKSIKYCFDGSGLTNRSIVSSHTLTQRHKGFGMVSSDLSNNMYSNYYVGTGDSLPLLDPMSVNTFWAFKYYNNDSSGKETVNADILSKTDVSSRTDVAIWDVYKDAADNKLNIEIMPIKTSGLSNGAYVDIDSLDIYWDNYIKAEFLDYYNDETFYEGYTSGDSYLLYNPLTSGEEQESVVSYHDIAVAEYSNNTHKGERTFKISDYISQDNYNQGLYDRYAYSVFLKLLADESNPDLSTEETQSKYIEMLYDNAFFMSEDDSKLVINYTIKLVDIDGNECVLPGTGENNAQISEVINAYLCASFDINSAEVPSDFNKDMISHIIITVNGVTLGADSVENKVGIRGIYWKSSESEETDPAVAMSKPDSSVLAPVSGFEGKDISDTVAYINSNQVSLSKISREQSDNSVSYYLNSNIISGMNDDNLDEKYCGLISPIWPTIKWLQ
ncbi:prepilin-type N-terminal cleavage/methylation domain-containing protein [Lachnospiraceae bacterium NE2001]|nr:prepilin-type N-terminal cleavage/methylation domain-containing protein [Lachnospiraceae bacterium NE2001]